MELSLPAPSLSALTSSDPPFRRGWGGLSSDSPGGSVPRTPHNLQPESAPLGGIRQTPSSAGRPGALSGASSTPLPRPLDLCALRLHGATVPHPVLPPDTWPPSLTSSGGKSGSGATIWPRLCPVLGSPPAFWFPRSWTVRSPRAAVLSLTSPQQSLAAAPPAACGRDRGLPVTPRACRDTLPLRGLPACQLPNPGDVRPSVSQVPFPTLMCHR